MNSRLHLLAVVLLFGFAASEAAEQSKPYPLEYFALREAMNNVEVSPDGKRVAMLRILTRNGDPILHVYDASDLDNDPLVVNSDPMEIRSYSWVSDTDIVLVLRQKMRDKIGGQNEGVYSFKIALLDVVDKEFDEFDMENPRVEHILPNEPEKIVVSMQPGLDESLKIKEAFRPRAYYKFDLKRGSKQLLIRGKLAIAQIDFDGDGNPRFARGFDRGSKEYVWYYRAPGASGWDEFYRLHEDSFESFAVHGMDDTIPGNVIVHGNNGHDIQGLWSYNMNSKSFEELIYRRSDVDVVGVRFHSNVWTHPDTIVGVAYFKDKYHFEYFDEIEGATNAQLAKLIPYSHYTRMTSRSRDGNTISISNSGPRDPGTYYLYKDGLVTTLGSRQPLMASEDLADVEYITYKARDGRKIPGFVTIPNGDPPYPLVVLPHGGPFVQERVIHDEWAQMFANNGYMVLQPQYRGSKGYGLEHYQSAWIDGSESGYAMQDDKDDGALHLIKEGLADPERVAMFGWSYGGYAALVAASRTPQIYQCVIAGAAVSDMVRQVNTIANEQWFRGAAEIEQMSYRKGAVNPVEEVEKVNVPVLLIHGSVDQRVQPVQAKIYIKELERFNKPYKFVELEGADHFYDTLFFEHQIELYESMIDFLQNDCRMKTELRASNEE